MYLHISLGNTTGTGTGVVTLIVCGGTLSNVTSHNEGACSG